MFKFNQRFCKECIFFGTDDIGDRCFYTRGKPVTVEADRVQCKDFKQNPDKEDMFGN